MAEIRFAHVGLGDAVCVNHVLAIIQNGSVTAKRYQDNAKKIKKYIDATHGKTIKSFILLDEGTVIASHISVSTLQKRMNFGCSTDTGLMTPPPVFPYGAPDDDDDDEDQPYEVDDVEDPYDYSDDEEDDDE